MTRLASPQSHDVPSESVRACDGLPTLQDVVSHLIQLHRGDAGFCIGGVRVTNLLIAEEQLHDEQGNLRDEAVSEVRAQAPIGYQDPQTVLWRTWPVRLTGA